MIIHIEETQLFVAVLLLSVALLVSLTFVFGLYLSNKTNDSIINDLLRIAQAEEARRKLAESMLEWKQEGSE